MVVGIGLNKDFQSRSVMIGWVVLSGSVQKGAESTRVGPTAPFAVASMGSRGTSNSADTRAVEFTTEWLLRFWWHLSTNGGGLLLRTKI